MGSFPFHQVTVRQQQHQFAEPHRGFRVVAYAQECRLQIEMLIVLQVDELIGNPGLGQRDDLPQLALRQYRRTQYDLFRVLRRRHEDIGFRADLRLQGHHDAFAQAVDGRIRDLGELLAEIVVQRAGLLGEHRHRSVVAHRADRLAFILRQDADDLIALFGRDVEHFLILREDFAIEGFGRQPRIDEVGLQIAHPLLEPDLVRMAALEKIVDPFGRHELGGLQIERQHFTRAELALVDDILRSVVPDAGLRGDGDVPILGDHPARGPQAVAVQRAAGIAPVGEHDAGRPVPGLHMSRVVLIKGFQVRIDHVHRLPRRGHQHTHRMHGIEAAGQQHFQHVVERLRIGAGEGHQRQDVAQIRQQRRSEQGTARHGPAAVSLHRVDFTVMGQVSIRMRQAPLRQRIGGESLVEHHHRGFHARILKVRIKLRQKLRHDHALVDDGAGRQRRNVEDRILCFEFFLAAAAREKQFAIEGCLVEAGG